MKRLTAILLAALLLLPLGMLRSGASADTFDDLWAAIDAYEDARFSQQNISAATAEESDYAALTDGMIAIVQNWSGYVPGSLVRNGDFFIWDGTDGFGYGYSPRMRRIERGGNATGADPVSVSGIETVSYATKGGFPGSTDVAVFGPYYGLDSSFTNQYQSEGRSIAQATGGTCTVYKTNDATIDNIADALETCGVVIFDSHGNTDYASGSDYTSRANTSYLCITSSAGITQQDTATVTGPYGQYKHAVIYSSSSAFIDGTAIRNHMKNPAPDSLLWMAICLGMATDGMEAPLREQGVEVVYGYSQSVSFTGDYQYENYFWTKMKDGAEVKDAIAFMKQKVGVKDPYTNPPAYPIVVSPEDAYPGHGNVDKTQAVYAVWTLFSKYTVTAISSDTSLGTVSVSGTTITATPKTGCAVTGFEVTEGSATVTQSGDPLTEATFKVSAQSDCTVRVNFARREQVRVSFVTPAGVTCAAINAYVGDSVRLPSPSGTPEADAHTYRFYGWTDARVEDTETRPDFLKTGTTVLLTENRTFYALYSYAANTGSPLPEGAYTMLTGEPEDWSGSAVITYDGSVVLSADAIATEVCTAKAVVAIGDTGITVSDDVYCDVPDAYLYEIEAVGDGVYTLLMKSGGRYLCYSARGDKLSATTEIKVSSGKSEAYWTVEWADGGAIFRNNKITGATLRFNPDKGVFVCNKTTTGSPLTVFAAADCRLMYTTELRNGTPEPQPVEIEGVVEWNEEDVQFKGATAYVIANGAAQTPGFVVKNAADGSVVDPANYDYEYRENTNAGTGYVLVTFKGEYAGTCRGAFKIYLPATTETAVANVGNGIRLTWAPVEGAAGYVIYRRAWSATTNGWTDFVRWNNTTALEWTDTTVYAGTRYQYGVKAYFERRTDPVAGVEIGGNVGDNYNLGQVGPLRTTVRITTRELKSVTPGAKTLTVKWAGSSVFTGYQVQYAADTAFTQGAKTVKITDAKTVQTVLKNLKSGTAYFVRVRSYHEFNGMTYYGEWSNVLSATVK
ncbi:MAG: fibronectin type III domain-containing protein [Clostridia bacterium]|nr:fibronectin type III domain-containing protein [Clostridia bacterium]